MESCSEFCLLFQPPSGTRPAPASATWRCSSGTQHLDARDAAAFEVLTPLDQGEWHNVWMISDNAGDVTDVHIESAAQFPTQTQLTSGLDPVDFRFGTTDSLVSFFIRSAGALGGEPHVGSWYLDDLYLAQSGENLTDPSEPRARVPSISTWGMVVSLVSIGCFGLAAAARSRLARRGSAGHHERRVHPSGVDRRGIHPYG